MVGKIKRVTSYECPICHARFSGPGSKSKALACSLLPISPFDFGVGELVVTKVSRKRARSYEDRPEYNKPVRSPVYVVKARFYQRRSGGKNKKGVKPAHVKRYLVQENGANHTKERFYDEHLLVRA